MLDLLTIEAAADALNIHPNTIRAWAKSGLEGVRLRLRHIGASPRTTLEDIAAFNDAVSDAKFQKQEQGKKVAQDSHRRTTSKRRAGQEALLQDEALRAAGYHV